MSAVVLSLFTVFLGVLFTAMLHWFKNMEKSDHGGFISKLQEAALAFDMSKLFSDFTFDKNIIRPIMEKPSVALISIVAVAVVVLIVILWFFVKQYMSRILMYLRLGSTVEDEKGTYGTARWITKSDIAKGYANDLLSTEPDIVLGSLINPNKGSRYKNLSKYIIYMGNAKRSNKHTFVLAPSGAGKTFSVVLPTIISIIKKGSSYFATDPKGELFEETSRLAEKNGYTVVLLNFISMLNSMRFNVFEYIYNEIDVSLMASIILENTQINDEAAAGNDFWEQAETSLLKSIILYMYHYVDDPTLPKMFDFLIHTTNDELEMLFKKLPKDDPCRMAFGVYLAGPDNLKGNIKLGLSSRLDILIMSDVREFTGANDFDVRDLKKKKMAIYLMIPDTHNAFKFLINLFISMACVKVVEYIDKNRMNVKEANHEIYAILDEFKNVVKIPDFLKKLATYRSRKFNLIPVVQDIGQIKSLYPNDWGTFISNCGTKIILGAGDTDTAKWVSEYLGEAPIKEQMKMKEGGILKMSKTKQVTMKDAKKNLMNPDEVINLEEDEIIVMKKGVRPMKIFMVPAYAYKKEYKYMMDNKTNPYIYKNPFTTAMESPEDDIELIDDTTVRM